MPVSSYPWRPCRCGAYPLHCITRCVQPLHVWLTQPFGAFAHHSAVVLVVFFSSDLYVWLACSQQDMRKTLEAPKNSEATLRRARLGAEVQRVLTAASQLTADAARSQAAACRLCALLWRPQRTTMRRSCWQGESSEVQDYNRPCLLPLSSLLLRAHK